MDIKYKSKKKVISADNYKKQLGLIAQKLLDIVYKGIIKILILLCFLGIFIYALLFSDYKNPFSAQMFYTSRVICSTFKIKVHFSQIIKEECDKKYFSIEGLGGVYVVEVSWGDKNFIDNLSKVNLNPPIQDIILNKGEFTTSGFYNQELVLPNQGGLYFDQTSNKVLNESPKKSIPYIVYAIKNDNLDTVTLTSDLELQNYYLNVSYRFLIDPSNENIWLATKDKIAQTVSAIEINKK